jgi:hypothetical protein
MTQFTVLISGRNIRPEIYRVKIAGLWFTVLGYQGAGCTDHSFFAAQAFTPDFAIKSDAGILFYLFFYDTLGRNDISGQSIANKFYIYASTLQPILTKKPGKHFTKIGMGHETLGNGGRQAALYGDLPIGMDVSIAPHTEKTNVFK